MTRSELVDAITTLRGCDRATAERVVRTIFDAMSDALVAGRGIEIRGLGSFTIRSYRPYEGRNPRDGAAIAVPPKRLPRFKVGRPLRARIEGRARS